MADEVAASAGKAVGKTTVKAFMSPSFDTIKVIPQGIVEIVLRGSAVVLGFMTFVSAAACQGATSNYRLGNVSAVKDPISLARNVNATTAETYSASGWVIFLSFWVMVYQGLAILQLFLHVKLAYATVPLINWSVFYLVDIIVIGIAAVGYFCGAIPMAVYAARLAALQPDSVINLKLTFIVSSAEAASAFSFFSLFLMIGMIVYFLLAKYVLQRPSHGDSAPTPKTDVYAPKE